jgi:hypothetical protein
LKALIKNATRFGIVLVALLLFVNFSGFVAAASTPTSTESDFMNILNIQRISLGENSLAINSSLSTSAYLHSKDMAENGYFSHTSLDGRTFDQRIVAAGYTNWTGLAENIAYYSGPPDATTIYNMWKNSPGHYANMIGDFTDAGLGVYTLNNITYATLDLGKSRSPVPPPAAKLSFTAQPGAGNTAWIAFSTQPVVNVQDASGNTVTTSNAAVTLAITRGTGTHNAALSGTATVNAVNGVATFSGLSINLVGNGYTLTATSTGLTSATGTSFNVGAGNSGSYYSAAFNMTSSPNSYAYSDMNGVSNYTIQPGDYLQYDILWTSTTDFVGLDYTCTDGTTLRDSSSLDQNGLNAHPAVDISSRAYNTWYSRKIALSSGQAGKTISNYDIVCEWDGTAIKTAYIKNIRITDVNNTIRKMILVGDEASVSTTPHLINQGNLVSFVRNSAAVAAKLAFMAPPGASNTAGTAFGTQPVVKIQDAGGNTVTTSNAAVTLAITGGTGASGAVLSGTATVKAVNGVATFSGLSIDLAGTYTLTATNTGLTSAASTSFNVSAGNSGSYYSAAFNMTSSPNSYAYYDMNGVSNYTIQSGDYLQYDILWTSTTDFIGFDYACTDGTTLRDSSSLDQNGLNAHPGVDISSRAYNTWYSRKIALSSGQAGKTISSYDIVCEWDGTGTKTAYIKNIRITDVNNTIRKTILVGNEASITTSPHIINHGNLVSFVRNGAGNYYSAAFNMASSPNSYAYYDMNGVSNYTIQSGDYLQYDILWTSTTDLVGFDYTCADGTTLRDSSSLDQNGLNAHPGMTISSRAYNTWYSRKIALPAGQVGKTISNYDIACEWDGTGTKTAYITNIRITDVNNSIRKTILVGDEASVSTIPHLINQGNLVSFVRN